MGPLVAIAVGVAVGLATQVVARWRARDPRRLIAAVTRGAGPPVAATEPVLDAVRAGVLLPRFVPYSKVASLVPQASARPLAPWLEARHKHLSKADIVLARTSGHLLVLHGDIKAINTLVAQVPLADIRSVEVAALPVPGFRQSLLGLTLADDTAVIVTCILPPDDLTVRFGDPLTLASG